MLYIDLGSFLERTLKCGVLVALRLHVPGSHQVSGHANHSHSAVVKKKQTQDTTNPCRSTKLAKSGVKIAQVCRTGAFLADFLVEAFFVFAAVRLVEAFLAVVLTKQKGVNTHIHAHTQSMRISFLTKYTRDVSHSICSMVCRFYDAVQANQILDFRAPL